MNLKKFLSMIMVLSMTAAVFTGCGSSSDSTSDDSAVAGKKGTEKKYCSKHPVHHGWTDLYECGAADRDHTALEQSDGRGTARRTSLYHRSYRDRVSVCRSGTEHQPPCSTQELCGNERRL